MKYRILQLLLLLAFSRSGYALAAVDCAESYASVVKPFFSRKEIATINELRKQATNAQLSAAQRREAQEELLAITQDRLKKLGFHTRRRTIANDEIEGGQETFLQIIEAPDHLPIAKVIRNAKEQYGLRVGVNPILKKSAVKANAYFGPEDNLAVLDLLVLKDQNSVPLSFLHEIRHRYYLELLKKGIADAHHGMVTVVEKGFHLVAKGNPYDQYISFEELSTYFRGARQLLTKHRLGAASRTATRLSLTKMRALARAIIRSIDQVDWNLDPALVKIDYRTKTVTYPILRDGKPVAEFTHPMPQISREMSREQILAQLRTDFQQIRTIAEERILFAERELEGLQGPPTFFTSAETTRMKNLQLEAMSKESTPRERRVALAELMDLTQERFTELGFKTRRQTIANADMAGGEETFLQIVEAPSELPVGRVINRVRERYGLRIAVNPALEKSSMDTPAYFDETKNLAVQDVLGFQRLDRVPQDLLHEIRHRHYLQLKKDGKADVHHGSVSTLVKDFHLEKAGGPYDQFISFEELTTYLRDATVALIKLKRGEGTKKYAQETLGDLKRLSQGILKGLEGVDLTRGFKVDRRSNTVTVPVYRGKKAVAEISYPIPDLKADTDILERLQKDFGRLRVIAEERIEFAEEELKKLR